MSELTKEWRRKVTGNRPKTPASFPSQEAITEENKPIKKTKSSQSPPEEAERPRPKSRLATYLTTHTHRGHGHNLAQKVEAASHEPDWLMPAEQEQVLEPISREMCDCLMRRLQAHPFEDLPTRYGSLLSKLLEEHWHLSKDKHELVKKLKTEEERHRTELEELRISQAASISAQEDELEGLESSLDNENNEYWGNARSSEEAADGEGRMNPNKSRAFSKQWSSSPSRSMAKLSRKFLKASSKSGTTILQTPSPHLEDQSPPDDTLEPLTPLYHKQPRESLSLDGSDSSSIHGDLLPDEEEERDHYLRNPQNEKLAVHLTEYVRVHGVGTDSETIFLDIATILASHAATTASWSSRLEIPGEQIPIPSIWKHPENELTGTKPTLTRPSKCEENVRTRPQTRSTDRHRRGFSFNPGDDAEPLGRVSADSPRPPSEARSVLTVIDNGSVGRGRSQRLRLDMAKAAARSTGDAGAEFGFF